MQYTRKQQTFDFTQENTHFTAEITYTVPSLGAPGRICWGTKILKVDNILLTEPLLCGHVRSQRTLCYLNKHQQVFQTDSTKVEGDAFNVYGWVVEEVFTEWFNRLHSKIVYKKDYKALQELADQKKELDEMLMKNKDFQKKCELLHIKKKHIKSLILAQRKYFKTSAETKQGLHLGNHPV